MAQVSEKTLAWLSRVLHEYRDPQRSYSDAARTLSAFPTLSPATEVHHSNTGAASLLLTLSNTIPVAFRGTTYRFPLKIWIPQQYPREPPTVYMTPSAEMAVRPGQHVGVDGRVYHPYLAGWAGMWERATLVELIGFLQQAFAKEPPVVNRRQEQQVGGAVGPSLPPKQRVGSEIDSGASPPPPPRPPKPGDGPVSTPAYPERSSSRLITRAGPPLPPLPHERPQNGYGGAGPSQAVAPPFAHQPNSRPSGPPLPPLPGQQPQQPYPPQRKAYERSPVSPISPLQGYSELPETKYSHPPSLPQPQQYPPQQSQRQSYPQQAPPQQPSYYHAVQPQPHQPPPQLYPQNYLTQQPPPQKKQPPPDLLSDPFDIALTSPSTSQAPAPPIPPNPEKEHLLHALSSTLTHLAQQRISQSLSALPPLRAQQVALQTAHTRLQNESRHLDQLNQTLASNEAILRRSIRDCDDAIAQARSKPPPPIDDVLIATTVVANQLWRLCAEEAGCREAMDVLQRAVDKGRVSGEAFVRQMRSLGRERFLKMALARKCARGLGVEVGR